MSDSALRHWRQNLADIADGELFEVIANTLTMLLRELGPADNQDAAEVRYMLEGVRDEAIRRFNNLEHHSPEPGGNA